MSDSKYLQLSNPKLQLKNNLSVQTLQNEDCQEQTEQSKLGTADQQEKFTEPDIIDNLLNFSTQENEQKYSEKEARQQIQNLSIPELQGLSNEITENTVYSETTRSQQKLFNITGSNQMVLMVPYIGGFEQNLNGLMKQMQPQLKQPGQHLLNKVEQNYSLQKQNAQMFNQKNTDSYSNVDIYQNGAFQPTIDQKSSFISRNHSMSQVSANHRMLPLIPGGLQNQVLQYEQLDNRMSKYPQDNQLSPSLLQSKISLLRQNQNASVNDLFMKATVNSTILPQGPHLNRAKKQNQMNSSRIGLFEKGAYPTKHGSMSSMSHINSQFQQNHNQQNKTFSTHLPSIPKSLAHRHSYRGAEEGIASHRNSALQYQTAMRVLPSHYQGGLQRQSVSLKFKRLSHFPSSSTFSDRFSSQKNLDQMISKIQLIQKLQEAYEAINGPQEESRGQGEASEGHREVSIDQQDMIKQRTERQKLADEKNRKIILQKNKQKEQDYDNLNNKNQQKNKKILIIGKNLIKTERTGAIDTSRKVRKGGDQAQKINMKNGQKLNNIKRNNSTLQIDSDDFQKLQQPQHGDNLSNVIDSMRESQKALDHQRTSRKEMSTSRISQIEYYQNSQEPVLSPIPKYEKSSPKKEFVLSSYIDKSNDRSTNSNMWNQNQNMIRLNPANESGISFELNRFAGSSQVTSLIKNTSER